MKNYKVFIFSLLLLVLTSNSLPHNEYYKLQDNQMVLTTDVSEAIKWENYTSLPISILFTSNYIPSELVLEDIIYDLREAYNQWSAVDNSCVSFTEIDPDELYP